MLFLVIVDPQIGQLMTVNFRTINQTPSYQWITHSYKITLIELLRLRRRTSLLKITKIPHYSVQSLGNSYQYRLIKIVLTKD
jgi:hypothetical protein